MKALPALIALAPLACVCFAGAASHAPAPLKLAVQLPKDGLIRTGQRCAPFGVRITNTSKSPLRIWKEWCSWGYSTVSLKLTDGQGRIYAVHKKPRDWAKNTPDPLLIKPGAAFVWKICLDPDVWEGLPDLSDHGVRSFSVRAELEIKPGRQASDSGVWTGHIVSEPVRLKLSQARNSPSKDST